MSCDISVHHFLCLHFVCFLSRSCKVLDNSLFLRWHMKRPNLLHRGYERLIYDDDVNGSCRLLSPSPDLVQ